jgi:hypothetical protein
VSIIFWVIPAKAGIQLSTVDWIPAFAATTFWVGLILCRFRYVFYCFPNTVFRRSVTRAAGSLRILRSSSANTKKSPSSALSTT